MNHLPLLERGRRLRLSRLHVCIWGYSFHDSDWSRLGMLVVKAFIRVTAAPRFATIAIEMPSATCLAPCSAQTSLARVHAVKAVLCDQPELDSSDYPLAGR